MKIFLNDYSTTELEKAESILFNGNGFLGVRGNLEEFYYDNFSTNRETYINGYYETKKIEYPERYFGAPELGESMISVVDGQTSLIFIGEEQFNLFEGKVLYFERYVDLKRGYTIREVEWESPKGLRTKIIIKRLASFVDKSTFSTRFEFEKINHNEEIELEHHLNYAPVKTIDENDPRINQHIQKVRILDINAEQQYCKFTTRNSSINGILFWEFSEDSHIIEENEQKIIIRTKANGTYLEKHLSYFINELPSSCCFHKFEDLEIYQKNYLSNFWENAQIKIKSEDSIEESVNFGTYALLQSLGTDGRSSIAAKGLSGSGYEGHYFWDTEMYIFPVFLHLNPDLAKKILEFRINTLEKAKKNREMVGYAQGALYPWRTISGTESSAFFEAGMAQHHINADIAYAFISYYRFTKDVSLFLNGGFEVLLETAKLFLEIGYLENDSFHIDKITGPDEYNVLVDDNYYTNRLVAYQFEWIVKLSKLISAEFPEKWLNMINNLSITEELLETFSYYSKNMALPLNANKNIIAQDRAFLTKAIWPHDKNETKFPLLLNYHPLKIYRYQICKQADAVLAAVLFPNEYDQSVYQNTAKYYDEITTHDSSLSYSIFSTLYARLNMTEKAYEYFLENARCDLDNLHKNTKDGIHAASMGGTIFNIIYGFCNLEINNGILTVNPNLPKRIHEIKFRTYYLNDIYEVTVTREFQQIKKVKDI